MWLKTNSFLQNILCENLCNDVPVENYNTSHEDKPVTAGADVVFCLDGFAVTGGKLGIKIEALSWFTSVFFSFPYISDYINVLTHI